MRNALRCLIGSLVLLVASGAAAVTISLLPSTASVEPGDSFSIDIQFSDLGSGVPPSVGVFDLDFGFDPALVNPLTVAFGDPGLGDQLAFGFPSFRAVGGGAAFVNVFELSFDSVADLNSMQADSFIAATVVIDALAPGLANFDITVITLGDALGNPLDADVIGTSVRVIPEPAAFVLFPLGVLLVARRSRTAR